MEHGKNAFSGVSASLGLYEPVLTDLYVAPLAPMGSSSVDFGCVLFSSVIVCATYRSWILRDCQRLLSRQ